MGPNHVTDKASQDHMKDTFPRPRKPVSQKGQTRKNICAFSQGSSPEMHIGQKHKNGNGIPTLKLWIEAQVLLHQAVEIHKAPKSNPGGEEHHHIVIEAQPLRKGIINPFDKQSSGLKSIKPIFVVSITPEIDKGI